MASPKLGTVCHNGHPMQATIKIFMGLSNDIPKDTGVGYEIDVYCMEGCDDIPDVINDNAFAIFSTIEFDGRVIGAAKS